jgi:ParB-like chromosome segregation protein Spo0J
MSTFELSEACFDDDGRVNEQVVQVLLERLRRNLPVYAVILARRRGGRFFVIDGRCRIEAARRYGAKTIDAYVIEADDLGIERLQELRREANLRFRSCN